MTTKTPQEVWKNSDKIPDSKEKRQKFMTDENGWNNCLSGTKNRFFGTKYS